MNSTFAITVLLLYGLALALVGLWAGKQVRRASDFYVAGYRLGPGLLAATVLAANIGAGTTVGVTGYAYQYGAQLWWWVGSAAIGTTVLAWTFGPRIWRAARDSGCYTVGDYLESRYGPTLRVVVMGILWLASLLVLMSQIVALGRIAEALGGASLAAGIVLGGGVVLVYYTAGGLWSSTVVNVVQLGVKLVAFPLALLATARIAGGIDAFEAAADVAGPGYLSPLSLGWLGIVGYLGAMGTSFVISPGIVQKAFGARDAATVRRGLSMAAIGLFGFAFIPVTIGMLARAHWPMPLQEGTDWVLPQLLVSVLPPAVGLLALAALVSAELSSADAVLFMLSTSMSRDFYQRFWNPAVDDRGLMRAGRVAAVIGLVAAVVLALLIPSIVGGLTLFYGLLVIALAVPLIAGVYSRRTGNAAALASVATSLPVAGIAVWYTGGATPTNFWPYVVGIAAGAAVCAAVTARYPAPEPAGTTDRPAGR